jgi:uncharacterized membrane protein
MFLTILVVLCLLTTLGGLLHCFLMTRHCLRLPQESPIRMAVIAQLFNWVIIVSFIMVSLTGVLWSLLGKEGA